MESVTFAGTSFNSNITVGSLEVSGQDYTLAIEAEDGTETLYFTLGKPAAYTVTLGANAEVIAAFDTFEDGPVAGDELVVIKVNTSSAVAGGDVDFTLIVGEPPGKTAVEIAVTVTVGVSGGPGLYVATGEGELEVLTKVGDSSITDLKTALMWLATNAEDETGYVVLIGEDSELSDDYRYTSKEGSSGVKVTLRGMDAERKIYWDPNATTNSYGVTDGVFIINPGTTLALGENVTFDGNSDQRTLTHANVASLKGGSFEMLQGSKITNVDSYSVIHSVNANGHPLSTIMLRGGAITNNMTYNSVISSAQNANTKLEMHDGAAITENTIYIPGTGSSASTRAPYILGSSAAVSLAFGGTFIMHGGEISYNSVRGVFIGYLNNINQEKLFGAVFDMRGGAIHHNGNDAIPMTATSSESYYAMAAGVIIIDASGKFIMTGGEISDNGSANSTLPYSGIYLNCRTPTSDISNNIVLNGSVAIKNNKVSIVGISSAVATFYLGENFTTANPIEVVVTIANNTAGNVQNYWNGKRLLASLPQNGLTIDAVAVGKFSVAGNYYMGSPTAIVTTVNCQELTGYTSVIDDGTGGGPGAGYIVVTANP
jgi:hypothetical protein